MILPDLAALAELERQHDDPLPFPALAAAAWGGAERVRVLRTTAVIRLHQRLAGETRMAIARRRARVAAAAAPADPWLGRLVGTLAAHRQAGRNLELGRCG